MLRCCGTLMCCCSFALGFARHPDACCLPMCLPRVAWRWVGSLQGETCATCGHNADQRDFQAVKVRDWRGGAGRGMGRVGVFLVCVGPGLTAGIVAPLARVVSLQKRGPTSSSLHFEAFDTGTCAADAFKAAFAYAKIMRERIFVNELQHVESKEEFDEADQSSRHVYGMSASPSVPLLQGHGGTTSQYVCLCVEGGSLRRD